MPIITDRQAVLAIYREAAARKRVLPCFCTENLTTTEAILDAVLAHGAAIGEPDLPISLAVTNRYAHRSQSANYTQTRRWDIGLKLFLADLHVLAGEDSPYSQLRILIHLDHTQFDADEALLQWDMNAFSSIMFDASSVPLDENIRRTRQFVIREGSKIVIEGACDEIVDATGDIRCELTTAEKAQAYLDGTGVDLIVANLGTEHRAAAGNLTYHGDHARRIREKVGPRIVLHGASSVPAGQIAGLADDGVCKVNLWTALERDASPVLFRELVAHADQAAGSQAVAELKAAGLLGPACREDRGLSIDFFTTVYRQTVVFQAMRRIVGGYLAQWYRPARPAR
ncbi:MAG: class II fructose-bisphosphate aldolase [Clostridiaceae bacterium]|jgi:fructose/tagatose bisphosphate aldolase|nr:class II fructose-bisphosphate aldolase [Clostridiaceae bacterium]